MTTRTAYATSITRPAPTAPPPGTPARCQGRADGT
jgi:hypothetical protein